MDEEDPVVAEVPVFISKTLTNKLHVLQYPVRPHSHTYDESDILKARVRPKCGQIELELGLKTKSYYYDRQKGEQIALNVDGAYRNEKASEDNFYRSNVMDKVVFTSNKSLQDVKRYAVGLVADGALHLSPLSSITMMKPKCSYLDLADKRIQSDKDADADKDSDEESNLRKVSVRFERNESEWSKNARERSYEFLQRKIREEPWLDMQVNRHNSERSEFDKRKLYCMYENDKVDNFRLNSLEYMDQLIPLTAEPEIFPNTINKDVSLRSLSQQSLQNHLRHVMLKANVATFTEVVAALHRGDQLGPAIVKALQQVAVLVQGCWVVKSDILYGQDEEKSAKKMCVKTSSTPIEILQRARDYALYLFTKNCILEKSAIEDNIDIPGSDLLTLLKGIACPVQPRGTWQFLIQMDQQFINKNKEVVQRQQMIWQSRHEQLLHVFKEQNESSAK